MLSEIAVRNGVPVALANQVGGNDELVFDGGSFVCDAKGRVVASLPLFETAARLDPGSVQTLMLLATAHLNLGHIEEGRAVMQRAAAIAPDDPRVTGPLQQLEEAIRRAQPPPDSSPSADPPAE